MPIPDTIAASVRPFPGPGVVAVSGGADSVALLRGLLALPSARPLVVAHFDHQLRPEAVADAEFVRRLADEFGLTFALGSGDVRAAGGNLEATARRLRYAWLQGVAAQHGAGWIATGHNANDNAETVLHHLARGTGLGGLRGIDPISRAGAVPVLRPLLAVSRAEIVAHLAALGQPHRTDATNTDTAFTRNRIRAELLPLVESFNPQAVAALGRLARQADELAGWLEGLGAELLRVCERPRAGPVVVLDAGVTGPRPVLAAMLQFLWKREGWPRGPMTAESWGRALEMLGDPGRAAEDFPGGVRMRRPRRGGGVVQIGPPS